jgi:hypothetical protein
MMVHTWATSWKLRFLALLASACLIVTLFTAQRPGGLDQVVWTVAYYLIAASTAGLGIWATRFTLRLWASLLIGTQVIRSISFLLFPPVPSLRWPGAASSLFLAIIGYFVWEGWRHVFPHDTLTKDGVIVPVVVPEELWDQSDTRTSLMELYPENTNGQSLSLDQSGTHTSHS